MYHYEAATPENIRSAIARVEAQRMMAFAAIGDTCGVAWTDEAETVWLNLLANVKGESR